MSQSVKQQMEIFLEGLDYDFEQFTVEGFAFWLERRRGRPIVFVEWELPPDVPGIWVACEECDYVYYDAGTVPIHHAHHRLHELGHILREHSGLSFVVNGDTLLHSHSGGGLYRVASCNTTRRCGTPSDESEDVEAEVLAALIQKRAWRSAVAPAPDDDFVNSIERYLTTITSSSD
jgi:hypothetical protein